jgi:hypothetical protein
MMSTIEFDSALLILKQRFGENKYPPALTGLLYAKFKNVSLRDFQKVCNLLAASEKFAPVYPQMNVHLAEKIREYREAKREQKKKSSGVVCTYCNNSGVIHFLEEWGSAEVAGKCWCEFGEEAEGMPLMNRERAVEGLAFDKKIRAEKAKEAELNINKEKLARRESLLKLVEDK